MKVVINKCYGGFGLSEKAYKYLGLKWDGYGYGYSHDYEKRTDKKLIKCVEELGKEASGALANLVIVEIPDDIEWKIDEYDGIETIHEQHRSWA